MSNDNNTAKQPGCDVSSEQLTQAAHKSPSQQFGSDSRPQCSPRKIKANSLSEHCPGEKQTHQKMGKTLFGEVLSGYLIDVPNLVEEKLSDKALDRGLGRWVHRAGSEKCNSFTTKVSKMVSHLMEKSILGKIGSYSRLQERWVAWRATKRALLKERLQKEDEEEETQEKQQVERVMHSEQDQPPQHKEHPDGEQGCEQAKQSNQEESPELPDQPEQIVQQALQPASESSVKKKAGEEQTRLSDLSDEENTTNFLNAIGNNIREMYNIDERASDARVFSARFRYRSPADAAVDCIRKPDVVVLERWAADGENATWRDIKALLEIKSKGSKADQRNAFLELLHCVRMVFAAQVNRRFVMGATICGDIMTFYIFDRSGCLASEKFNMNENVERVVRVVCGMLFVDEVRLGYDPAIFRNEDGQIVVTFKGVEYICDEDPLYVEKSVRGRGTGCFKTVYLGEPAVIKDAWVDDSRRRLEHDILEKVEGVEGVVKMVGHEIVQVPDEDDVLVDDTTSECRKTLMKDNLWTTNAKWSGFHLVETRTHRRIMLQPCGEPLEGFANLEELLRAIKDIVKCVQDLLEKKVLHRDISLRNIILARANPKDPSSRVRGYLIDFDYALYLENQSEAAAKGARTGTLPFMALEMLAEETSNRVKHAYYHDLESIFYVLCWVCTSQEGPNSTERDHQMFDFNKSEVAKWTGAGMDNPTFDAIQSRKTATVLSDKTFFEKILGNFAPYFDPIKPCVLALRDVMVNKGSNSDDPLIQKRVDSVKETIEVLRNAGRPIPSVILKDFPNSERESCDVFELIHNIIDGTLATLIEPPLPQACTPEAKAKAKAEEEARKEAKRMKFRKYISIREMREERETNLGVKESDAVDEDEETEEGGDDPCEKPGSQSPTRATSSHHSLLKQATMNLMNARNSSSSVPGLTRSGPSDSASGTSPRSIPSSSSSPKPAPRIGPPSSMEFIGSKCAFDGDDERSGHGAQMRKKAEKQRQLPQPNGPSTQRASGDSTMPSSIASSRWTGSKRSLTESPDDDSVASDSQKRMRLEHL